MNTGRFRLVECPAYTAIEEIATKERLVTIHTRATEGGEWLNEEQLKARKRWILEIFNSYPGYSGK